MTASNNVDKLENVLFVISVNVKSLEENDDNILSCIKRSKSKNNGDKSQQEYKSEERRIVNNNVSRSEVIALLEYDCCSEIVVNSKEKRNIIDYDPSHNNNSFNNEHVYEGIT